MLVSPRAAAADWRRDHGVGHVEQPVDRQLGQKARRPRRLAAAEQEAGASRGEGEPTARPGHADVGQPPLLLEALAGRRASWRAAAARPRARPGRRRRTRGPWRRAGSSGSPSRRRHPRRPPRAAPPHRGSRRDPGPGPRPRRPPRRAAADSRAAPHAPRRRRRTGRAARTPRAASRRNRRAPAARADRQPRRAAGRTPPAPCAPALASPSGSWRAAAGSGSPVAAAWRSSTSRVAAPMPRAGTFTTRSNARVSSDRTTSRR